MEIHGKEQERLWRFIRGSRSTFHIRSSSKQYWQIGTTNWPKTHSFFPWCVFGCILFLFSFQCYTDSLLSIVVRIYVIGNDVFDFNGRIIGCRSWLAWLLTFQPSMHEGAGYAVENRRICMYLSTTRYSVSAGTGEAWLSEPTTNSKYPTSIGQLNKILKCSCSKTMHAVNQRNQLAWSVKESQKK